MADLQDILAEREIMNRGRDILAARRAASEQSGTDIPVQSKEQKQPSKDLGAVGTAVATAASEALPTAAGFAGGVAATEAASPVIASATAVNPFLGGATAVGAFLLGSVLPSAAARWGQKQILNASVGEEKADQIYADFQANKEKYPLASLIGGLGAQMPFMKLNPAGVGEAFAAMKEMGAAKNTVEWASKTENIGKVANIMNVAFGASLQGGQNLLDQMGHGDKDFNALEFAGNIAAGALMNKPTEFAEYLGGKIGGNVGKLLRARLVGEVNATADNILGQYTQDMASGKLTQEAKASYDQQAKLALDGQPATIPAQNEVTPEAAQAIDKTVADVRQRVKELEAGGRKDAADILSRKLDEIQANPDVRTKVAELQKYLPDHKSVRELTDALDEHNLLGTKADVDQRQAAYTPGTEAATKAELASKRMELETKFVDRFAGVKRISPEAKQGISDAMGKTSGSMSEYNTRSVKAVEDLNKAAKLAKVSPEQLRGDADSYITAKRLLEVNNEAGKDGFTGFTNAELQKQIQEIEGRGYFAAIDRYKKFFETTVEEHRLKLLEAGKIDQAEYEQLKKNKDYIPLYADRSAMEAYNPTTRRRGKAFQAIDYLQDIKAGQRERIQPLEALTAQRNMVERDLFNQRVFETLKQQAAKNPKLSSVLDFNYTPKEGQQAGSYLTFDRPNGGKEFVNVKSPELARALNDLDREIMPDMLNLFGRINHFVAEMAVHKNPLFTFTQLAYDMQAMLQNIQATPIAGKRIELLKNWLSSFGDAVKGHYGNGSAEYNEFVKSGAAWGHNGFMSAEESTKRILAEAARKSADGPFAAMMNTLHYITSVNEALPNALRFGAWKTAKQMGLSQSQMVEAAQKIMPNYQDRGTTLRAIGNYKMFVNASIQGSKRFIESTFYDKNGRFDPRGFMGFLAAAYGTQAVIRTANDSKDEAWREKWNADRNWVFVIDRQRAITIPMEWAQRPIHQMAGLIVDATNGRGKIDGEELKKVFAGTLEAYSPIGGGSSLGSILAPSFAQPLIDVGANKGYAGKAIVNKGLETRIQNGLPPELAFYDDTNKSLLGVASKEVAAAVNGIGANATPQQVQYLFRQWFAAPAAFADGNIGSRFYKEMTPERAQQIEDQRVQDALNADQKGAKTQDAIDKFEMSRRVREYAEDIQNLELKDQKRAIMKLAEIDYDTAFEVNQYLRHQAAGQYNKMSKPKKS